MAQLVDGIIINAFVSIVTFLVDHILILSMYSGELFISVEPAFLIYKVWYILGYWCILLLYEVIFSGSSLQATPGKLLLNMKIVDKQGSRISYFRSLMRFLSKFLSGILGIGFLMILFTKYKQGLHDKIADTVVVQHNSNCKWIYSLYGGKKESIVD